MSTQERLGVLLERAIKLEEAEKGNVQALDERTKTLSIVCQRGFKADFLEHFRSVKAYGGSACGRAAGLAVPVLIRDVQKDPAFEPHRAVAARAGFRAVRSHPLLDSRGKLHGVVSVHWRLPRTRWRRDPLERLTVEIAEALAEIYSTR